MLLNSIKIRRSLYINFSKQRIERKGWYYISNRLLIIREEFMIRRGFSRLWQRTRWNWMRLKIQLLWMIHRLDMTEASWLMLKLWLGQISKLRLSSTKNPKINIKISRNHQPQFTSITTNTTMNIFRKSHQVSTNQS